MSIVIDDSTILEVKAVFGALTTLILGAVGYLKTKGYLDILIARFITPSEVIHAVKNQNGNALDKLNTEDDLFCILENFELDKNGHVTLKGESDILKLLNRTEPPLTLYEKDKIIRAMKNMFCVKKE